MMMNRIEVLSIRLMEEGRPLRAFADVRVGDWTINDWRVWQQNGRAYVSPPQTSWKDPTGQIKFKPILTIPDEELQRIQTAILYAYHQEMEKQNAEKSK
jgi:DNA-binding cell septation regulator SpoVG